MKIKKEYIRPVMEVLDPEVGPLMQDVVTTISVPKGSDISDTDTEIIPEDELSRKNDLPALREAVDFFLKNLYDIVPFNQS